MRSALAALALSQAARALARLAVDGADRRVELGQRDDEAVGHGCLIKQGLAPSIAGVDRISKTQHDRPHDIA